MSLWDDLRKQGPAHYDYNPQTPEPTTTRPVSVTPGGERPIDRLMKLYFQSYPNRALNAMAEFSNFNVGEGEGIGGIREQIKNTLENYQTQGGMNRAEAIKKLQGDLAEHRAMREANEQAAGGIKGLTVKPAANGKQAAAGPTVAEAQANRLGIQGYLNDTLLPMVQNAQQQMYQQADLYEAMMGEIIPNISNPIRQQILMMYMPQVANNLRQRAAQLPSVMFGGIGEKGSLADVLLGSKRRQQSGIDFLARAATAYGEPSPYATNAQGGSATDLLNTILGGGG